MLQALRGMVWLGLLGWCLGTGPSAFADDYEALKPVIERGITSAGGRELLTKRAGTTLRFSGVYHGGGSAAMFSGRLARQRGKKMRVDVENVYLMVFDGDRGWMSANGNTLELDKDQADGVKSDLYVDHVATLLPLGTPGYRVTKLPEAIVDGQPAVALRVEKEGQRTVDLWLSKESGLVLKRANQVRSTERGGALVNEETLYSQFQAHNGVKTATRSVSSREGEKYIELDVSDVQHPEQGADNEFQKP
ncbi:MAG: hypothetical protein ACKOFW_01780 [Planctomycetaceae bacterium]